MNKNWQTIIFFVAFTIGIVLIIIGIVLGNDISNIRLEGSDL